MPAENKAGPAPAEEAAPASKDKGVGGIWKKWAAGASALRSTVSNAVASAVPSTVTNTVTNTVTSTVSSAVRVGLPVRAYS